jgi:F-type H+-transporting ATPase subunit b
MRIDWWTLALQTVNVLILIWILARFFFRPIMNIVTTRQEEANKLLAAAAHARQDADEARADAGKARAKIAAEQERLIAEARNAGKIEKQSLLAQTAEEVAKLRSEAAATVARDRAAAEEAMINRASELAVAIAQRLLARFADQNVFHTLVDEICREVRALSAEARESLASAAATTHPIEIVTAVPLSGEETQHLRAALKAAFGAELPFTFQADPAIIAGIELKCQNTIIRNSWRADLDRIRHELSRDKNVP